MTDGHSSERDKRRPPDGGIELDQKEVFTNGLVQVYTGAGKGKTTAALGLACRAAGQGLSVLIVQFMKGVAYGELSALRKLENITIVQFGEPHWVHPSEIRQEDKDQARRGLDYAERAVFGGEYQLVVLDEVNVALSYKLLPVESVVDLIRRKPANVELVLTGRGAPKQVLELADLVTKMVEVKHPYHKGVLARRGIEY